MSELRALLHKLADAVADHLESLPEQARYYDQDSSPLPAQTHCRLVRRGVLPGFKRHGRVLVERAVMHRYIEQGQAEPAVSKDELDDAVAAAVSQLQRAS